jgi:hypothetical protein
MKVKIIEEVGHVKGAPLIKGKVIDVDDKTGSRMIAAEVAEIVKGEK